MNNLAILDMPNEAHLAPHKHQTSLFACDLNDIAIREDMASMAYPVFALRGGDMQTRRFEFGDASLEIQPSALGLPTVNDYDIMVFVISQLMEAKKRNMDLSKEVRFYAKDFFVFSNRHATGRYYEYLRDSLNRLGGCLLQTTVETGGEKTTEGFHLIESFQIRQETKAGRVTEWAVTISDWLMRAIESNEVLTLHPNYFRLESPLEKRIYQIARKFCGKQAKFEMKLEVLRARIGTQNSIRKLRFLVKGFAEKNHFPDYSLTYDDERGVVTFRPRNLNKMMGSQPITPSLPVYITEDIARSAREKIKGWDFDYLLGEYLKMIDGKRPKNVRASFLAYIDKFQERHGSAPGYFDI